VLKRVHRKEKIRCARRGRSSIMAVSQQPAFTPICYLTEAMFRGVTTCIDRRSRARRTPKV
jgi:hypothetical protein